MVGKSLSHYKILEELGRGGMGIVYKAEDMKLDRTVAIKVLPPATLASEDDRARFYREAKAAAQLHHPHIASVFEIDEAVPEGSNDDDLRPFIAMEYIEGKTLDAKIKEGPLPMSDAVRITSEVASALEAAHKKDIVHRDIKSQNVMLTEDGSAKVLDFGLAQTAQSTRLTQAGSTVGTIAYMSPEQARGEEVDCRTDIWSLGVVLYEMISGRMAFPGEYEQAVVYEILNQDPEPLTALRTGVSLEIERIVSKCISKDAKTRYQHADDLIADLTAVDLQAVTGMALSTIVPNSGEKGYRRALRYGISALLGGAIAVLLYSQFGGPNSKMRPQTVRGMIRVTIESDVEMWPTIHPNGDQVVYGAGQIGDMRLFYRLVDGGPPHQLIDDMDAHQAHPSYSPDGNQVLFASEGSIYTVGSLGGTPRPVVRPSNGQFFSFPAWAPDGDQIVFTNREDSIHVVNISDNRKIFSVLSRSPHSLSWSPDGRHLAFVSVNLLMARVGTNIAPTSIWILRVSDGEMFQITSSEFMDLSPVWSPSGDYLYYISNQGGGIDMYRREFESKDPATSGPDERLTTGLSLNTIDLSADGSRMVGGIIDYSQNIWTVALDADRMVTIQDAIPITSGNQVIEGIAVSPDGARIAYSSNAKGISNVFVVSLLGGHPLQITSGNEPDFIYDWSPTGDELAYHKFVDGSRDIYTASIDDLTETLVSDDANHDALPIWMGDSKTIGFVRDVVANPKFVVSEQGDDGVWGPAEILISNMELAPSWSSVNQLLVYEADQTIRTFDPTTGESKDVVRPLVENRFLKGINTFDPLWSEDGKIIYFASTDSNGNHGYFSVPKSGGEVEQIMSFDGQSRGIGRATIQGNNIYFTVAEVQSDIWVLELDEE